MTDWRKKEKRERKAKEDKAQVKFTIDREKIGYQLREVERVYHKIPTDEVVCPFCLYKAELRDFFMKGTLYRVQCPDCEITFLLRTAIRTVEMSPKEFAKWVFDYGKEFWNKCEYKRFIYRMSFKYGFSEEFWNEYRRLKGERNYHRTGIQPEKEKTEIVKYWE